jgi:hypothetical protein
MKRKTTAEEGRERLAALRRDRAADVVAQYGGLLDGLYPPCEAGEAREVFDEPWRVPHIPGVCGTPQPSKRKRGRPEKPLAEIAHDEHGRYGLRRANLLEAEDSINFESLKRQERRVRERQRRGRT